jgi:hypothetical protein
VQKCREGWLRLLYQHLRVNDYPTDSTLLALAHAGAPDLPKYLRWGLKYFDLVWDALSIIEADPSWCPYVYDLCEVALGWAAKGNDSLLQIAYIPYLSKHGYRIDNLFDLALRAKEPSLHVLIPMAIQHRRPLLLRLLRTGLRSSQGYYRLFAAAILARYDTDWSRKELRVVLDESDSWEATSVCRVALSESRDASATQAAVRWALDHSSAESRKCRRGKRALDSEQWLVREVRSIMREHSNLIEEHRDYDPTEDEVPAAK